MKSLVKEVKVMMKKKRGKIDEWIIDSELEEEEMSH